MHITAHPDDEDGATLTWLSRGRGAEVYLLSLTRGESGANLVTGDFFDRLGVLRSAELQRAAQYYGAQVFFTRAVDYGYSKNVAETFRQWDRRVVLRDMVRTIRQLRPHVLISRWSGTSRDGHGNHEAAGILAQEAFAAAGDPNSFPELAAEGSKPWQPFKLYIGNRNALDDWTIRVEHGGVDPLLGRSYSQFAREGLRAQRSQGAGAGAPRPGETFSYYKLAASKVGDTAKERDFFERIDISYDSHPEYAKQIEAAFTAFRVDRPSAVAPHLASARQLAQRELPEKIPQIDRALALALGLQLEARVEPRVPIPAPMSAFRAAETFSVAVPGQSFSVAAKLYGTDAEDLQITGASVTRMGNGRFQVTIPPDAPVSKVNWSRDNVRETSYKFADEQTYNLPAPLSPLMATARYRSGEMKSPVMVSSVDRLGVERLKPLVIGPPIAVRFATEAGIFPATASSYNLHCIVSSNVDEPAAGDVKLDLPAGWRSEPGSLPFRFEKEREETTLQFRIIAPSNRGAGDASVGAVATYKGKPYSDSFEEITQPGLESLYLSKPARHLVRTVNVKVASNLRIGYITGTGDDVPEALRQLNIPVDLIDPSSGDLSKYSTILLGIRTYAARTDVRIHNRRLLDYVASGGVLIVQYNTPEFDKNYGPYPYTMGRNPEEVSEEDSPITILDPADPVFETPNLITPADFEGWVEQRGSKFLATWDPKYKALLATNDTGQASQKGGWLVARHGKGLYVYCAYAWYRQLPYAVPGAVRLFANLISLGAADSPWRAH